MNTARKAIDSYEWVQWTTRKRMILTAFAVDPDSPPERRRTMSGSMIPERAVPAEPDTPRDPFCIASILSRSAAT